MRGFFVVSLSGCGQERKERGKKHMRRQQLSQPSGHDPQRAVETPPRPRAKCSDFDVTVESV